MTKIGLFGGAFDPIHNGHISVARSVFDELKLKKMIIMPTGISPHKSGKKSEISFEHRFNMCKLAFEDNPDFEISDFEGKTHCKNYTIDTLRSLKKSYPANAQFYLIIGGDMLFYLPKWFKYESLLKESKVVAVAREDKQYISMLEFATEIGHVKVLNMPVVEVSSTDVRQHCQNGEDISQLVPPAVSQYIKENNLYV